MERKNAWLSYDKKQKKELMTLAENYRVFISRGKTERECVELAVAEAEKAGYISLKEAKASGKKLVPGDKVYDTIMGKSLALFTIGTEPWENGMNILGAHIDSPRLDIKQNPLYEDTDIVLMGYALLRRHQEISVGCHPARAARRCGQEGRHRHQSLHRREPQGSGPEYYGSAAASGCESDVQAGQQGRGRRGLKPHHRQ